MKTETAYEEIFIKSIGSPVKLRVLSPSEMELLESMSEADREAEFLLQGIYNPGEFMKQLTRTLGRDLVNLIVSPTHENFEEKLHQIKLDLLDAICEVNELAHLKFRKCETLVSDLGQCMVRIGVDGRIHISSPEKIDPGKTRPEPDDSEN